MRVTDSKAWLFVRHLLQDLPRICRGCGIETAEPVYCHWCSLDIQGGDA